MSMRSALYQSSCRLTEVFLLLQVLIFTISGHVTVSPEQNDSSDNEDHRNRELWIYEHDPVKVGHVQHLELEPGKVYRMETMAVKPPVFVIPNFLTDEECERIKHRAQDTGLSNSKTHRKKILTTPPSTEVNETFTEFDTDRDGTLNPEEAGAFILSEYNISLDTDEVQFVMTQTSIDLDSGGSLDVEEFSQFPAVENLMFKVVRALKYRPMPAFVLKKLRRGKDRTSETVRLQHDLYDPDSSLRNRLAALTRIHPYIVYSSETLHVVHYNSGGHYHAHHDSQPTHYSNNVSVCEHVGHLYPNQSDGSPPKTRVCRFLTVLYYLNEPEQGGQTAFPMADNDTYTQEGFTYEFNRKQRDLTDLTNHCLDANLVVEAKKGMAVMWYNHHVEDGWIGELNNFSLHGGCEVHIGEKWIANHWINVEPDYDMQKAYVADRIRWRTHEKQRLQQQQQQRRTTTKRNNDSEEQQQSTSFNASSTREKICKIQSDWSYGASMATHDEL